MIKLKCNKCGHIITIPKDELDGHFGCELCSGIMFADFSEPEEHLERMDLVLDNAMMNTIKNEIMTMGSSRVWETIETIINEKIRAKMRKMFFVAGGKIPEQE
ncbi:MAG: DUF951 domain-containing protein, partial [Candidatus Margulisbacteria bacterium]|nr:DUF951 domain-containing protein [Candidatus Margulisiibacteriota bacterium]